VITADEHSRNHQAAGYNSGSFGQQATGSVFERYEKAFCEWVVAEGLRN
jgi:hypothetical protein